VVNIYLATYQEFLSAFGIAKACVLTGPVQDLCHIQCLQTDLGHDQPHIKILWEIRRLNYIFYQGHPTRADDKTK
jgi:hypothetical protein